MMKNVFLSLLATAVLLSADTLILKNGKTLEGSFVGGNSHSVRFAVGDQVNNYSIDEIDSIRFTNGASTYAPAAPPPSAPPQYASAPPQYASAPPPTTAPPPSAPAPPATPSAPPAPGTPAPGAYAQAANYPPAAAPPPPNAPPAVEVPSGSQIVVRLIDPVNSEHDRLGQTYRASIDQPVLVNGQEVIPRGADATATLIDLQQSGKIEGRTVLTLDLKTISVNGKTYNIVTTGVPEASKSRGARSAKVIGGAAALGAIIGAAAGGGRGAAIGAGSGAAAGTAAEVITSGQKVKIPAETRLTFTLQNPIDF